MKLHDIKKTLEDRRIEVSSNSWEKLAGQLDANDQKRKRISFIPYAACLAILVGLIFFLLNSKANDTQNIVNSPNELKPSHFQKDEQLKKEVFSEKEHSLTERTVVTKQTTPLKIPVKEETKQQITHTEIHKPSEELQKEVSKTIVVPKEIQTEIVETVTELPEEKNIKASILELSVKEKIVITDAEIDQLLNEAKKSLSELETKKQENITMFATADELLEEVELELDYSFKQKVFELIKNNLQKSRTVIANRD